MELIGRRAVAAGIEAVTQVVREHDTQAIIDLIDRHGCQERIGQLIMRLIKRRETASAEQQPEARDKDAATQDFSRRH